jgi:endonuclease/exonuclease/phosphatase family metal-dependent hydrolase
VTHAARPTLRIATYNIHRCRGLDGRTRPDRTAAVISAIDADVVALQEVSARGHATAGTQRSSARCSGWGG